MFFRETRVLSQLPSQWLRILVLLAGILLTSGVVSVINTDRVDAAIKYSELSAFDQARAYDYGNMLKQCFAEGVMHVQTSRRAVNAGNLFNTDGTRSEGKHLVSSATVSSFSGKKCAALDETLSPKILKFFDISGSQLFCAMGYTADDNCLNGNKDFSEPKSINRDHPYARGEAFHNALTKLMGTDFLYAPGQPALYSYWHNASMQYCGNKKLTQEQFNNTSEEYRFTLKGYDNNFTPVNTLYLSGEKMSDGWHLTDYTTPSRETKTCAYKIDKANSYAEAARVFERDEAAKRYCDSKGFSFNTGSTSVETLANACFNGFVNKSDPSYCGRTYAKNKASREACAGAASSNADDYKRKDKPVEEPVETKASSSCSIEGLGWLLCPVINMLAKFTDESFVFISEKFLMTDVDMLSMDPNNGTYTAWKAMRNVANVLFIIAFLIIVYSQLTGAGMSSYGVKKMLPRLIICAILVNASFLVCQIAVDLSNILGASLKDFLSSLVPKSGGGASGGTTFGAITASVLGLAAGAAIVYAFIGVLLPVLAGAFVALIMILFILLARQALIVLLIVLAPVAFVAFLLPNTEKWFTTWRKMFTALLVVFPVIAVVYGASELASNIIIGAFTNSNLDTSGSGMTKSDAQAIWGQIMGAAVATLPLFIVPGVLKRSLDGIGTVGAKINNLGGKAKMGAEKSAAKKYENSRVGQFKKYRQGESAKRRALIQSGSYTGGRGGKLNPRNAMSTLNRKFNQAGVSGKFGDRALATGAAIADKEDQELVANAGSRLDNMTFTDASGKKVPLTQAQMMQIATGKDVTDESGNKLAPKTAFDSQTRRAAIQRAAKIASVDDAHKLVDASAGMSLAERKTLSSSLAASSVLTKASYLGGKTLGQIEQGTATAEGAALEAMTDGRVIADTIANGDKTSAAMLHSVAQGTPKGSVARENLKRAYRDFQKPDYQGRAKVLTGSDHDIIIQSFKSL